MIDVQDGDVKDGPKQPGDVERIRAATRGHLVALDLILDYARMRLLVSRPAFDRLVGAARAVREELNGEGVADA